MTLLFFTSVALGHTSWVVGSAVSSCGLSSALTGWRGCEATCWRWVNSYFILLHYMSAFFQYCIEAPSTLIKFYLNEFSWFAFFNKKFLSVDIFSKHVLVWILLTLKENNIKYHHVSQIITNDSTKLMKHSIPYFPNQAPPPRNKRFPKFELLKNKRLLKQGRADTFPFKWAAGCALCVVLSRCLNRPTGQGIAQFHSIETKTTNYLHMRVNRDFMAVHLPALCKKWTAHNQKNS